MKSTNTLYLVAILVIIVVGSTWAVGWPSFDVDPDLSQNIVDIILKYLLITLVFERAVAVYSIVRFDGKQKEIQRRIRYFHKKISEYKKMHAASPATAPASAAKTPDNKYTDSDPDYKSIAEERPADDPVTNYLNLIEQNEVKLEDVSALKRKFSMRILMVVGALVAVAGLSVFHDILDIPTNWYAKAGIYQRGLTRFLDILTTAALIGGGSSSLHKLLSAIESVLDSVKQKQEP